MTETRMLGRRPPKNAPALRLAPYLTGVVPDHPAAADHFGEVADWGLYENDHYGDCGPVSAANQRKLVSRYLTDVEAEPSQDDVFALYRASGNPGFNPATGADDNGVDMQTMCEALVHTGIGGVKAVGFAKADHTNLIEVDAAIAIFGSLLLGVDLQTAQQTQTDAHLWDYQPSAQWGGHAILAGRYASLPPATGHDSGVAVQQADRTGVITWAQVVDCTDAFLNHQLDEAWVVIWPEHLGSRVFLEGVNLSALADDYRALTGRPFPAPVTPPPPPGPAPDPASGADQVLAAAAREWLTHRHTGVNADMARAFRVWLTSKNLQGGRS